jgi:transcriptional regulator with XRE-family HTH domain
MSTEESIGNRLFQIRRTLGLSQGKIADQIGTSDRSYKHYEAGTRTLPSDIAIALCVKFKIDLNWLLLGQRSLDATRAKTLAGACSVAVSERAEFINVTLTPKKTGRICSFLFAQCLAKGTDPHVEVVEIMDLASDLWS